MMREMAKNRSFSKKEMRIHGELYLQSIKFLYTQSDETRVYTYDQFNNSTFEYLLRVNGILSLGYDTSDIFVFFCVITIFYSSSCLPFVCVPVHRTPIHSTLCTFVSGLPICVATHTRRTNETIITNWYSRYSTGSKLYAIN